MVGFRTKNSIYYLDTVNKTITGGIFKNNTVRYTDINCLIGRGAYIRLYDGRVIQTGVVLGYI